MLYKVQVYVSPQIDFALLVCKLNKATTYLLECSSIHPDKLMHHAGETMNQRIGAFVMNTKIAFSTVAALASFVLVSSSLKNYSSCLQVHIRTIVINGSCYHLSQPTCLKVRLSVP